MSNRDLLQLVKATFANSNKNQDQPPTLEHLLLKLEVFFFIKERIQFSMNFLKKKLQKCKKKIKPIQSNN